MTPFERLEVLRKIEEANRKINGFIDKRVDTMLNRWDKVSASYYAQLGDTIKQLMMNLDTDNGRIESTSANLARVQRYEAELNRAIAGLNSQGKAFLRENGAETIEQLAERIEKLHKDVWIAAGQPEKADFLVINPQVIREIVNKSVLVWDDGTGKLAREIQSRLLGIVIRGESLGQAIKEYTKTVPAIEKPKRGGGTYRLSAEERAKVTMATEFVRMFQDASNVQAKEAWGEDYYVQNLNPMDERTSPQCAAATEAGIMKRDEFFSEHGDPPRHPNCRCSLASMPAFLAKGAKK